MSLKSRFYRFSSQALAVLDKVNGSPLPFNEIVQNDLDLCLKDAQRRRDAGLAIALMEAGARPGRTMEEADAEAAVYLSLYENKIAMTADGEPEWSADDKQFMSDFRISPD